MGERAESSCGGSCGIDTMITTVENLVKGYKAAAENETDSPSKLSPEAKLIEARAKLFRHIYNNMPKEGCPGDQLTRDGELHCPKRSVWNSIIEIIQANGHFISPEGKEFVSQEVLDDLLIDSGKRATRQQKLQTIGALEANQEINNEYRDRIRSVEAQSSSYARTQQSFFPSAINPQTPPSGGTGQYL